MSTRKSPFYTAVAILFSVIVLAGGAAKVYRGISELSGSKTDPVVAELLKKSDASIAEANRQSSAAIPAFQELLNDCEKLGVEAFRSDKRETCAKLTEQFVAVDESLRTASKTAIEASSHGTDKNTTEFLLALSKSYDLLVKANKQNIDIMGATLDESSVDMDTIVQKILSLAASREADQQAANQASAEAQAILKRS